jgi:hypothetical protein
MRGSTRNEDTKEGRWIVRHYVGEAKYKVEPIGLADDVRAADGRTVFSYEQAHIAAAVLADLPEAHAIHLTVRAAMAAYVAHKQALGQSTRDLVTRTAAHILPDLGNKRVDTLTPKRLRDWLATMAAMPRMIKTAQDAPQRYGVEPSGDGVRARRATANRVLTMLKAALNHAFAEGHVASDVAWRKCKPFRAVETARVRYLTVAEAQRLINASDREFRQLVRAALETGCRFSELTRLEVMARTPQPSSCPAVATPRHRPAVARQDHAAGVVPHPAAHLGKNLGHTDTRMVEKHYGHVAPSYVTDAIRAGAPRFGIEADAKVATLR